MIRFSEQCMPALSIHGGADIECQELILRRIGSQQI